MFVGIRLAQSSLVLAIALTVVSNNLLLSAERTLRFPDNRSVGVVTTLMRTDAATSSVFDVPEEIATYPALGEVILRNDVDVKLDVAGNAADDLTWLTKLEPGSIQSLRISGAAVDAEQLRSVTTLNGLVELDFRSCKFETDSFIGLDLIPSLRKLIIRDATSSGYASWVARLGELQSLYASPYPNLDDLRVIGAHPALEFTMIGPGKDTGELLKLLSRMPKLSKLSIRPTQECDANELDGLAELPSLKHLRWFGGTVSGSTLRFLSENPTLEKLIISQADLGEQFFDGLRTLTQLKEIEVIPSLSENRNEFGKQLSASVLGLPNLRVLPKLTRINADQLDKLLGMRQLERVSLNSISEDVTLEKLSELAKLPKLKGIDLQHISVDDQWLGCLRRARSLESIKLRDTAVTGRGFEQLSDLEHLSEIQIWFGSVDDAVIEPELSGLAAASRLESLQIGGFYEATDLEPLGELRNLKSLRVWGDGYYDDTTVATIASLPDLHRLTLDSNGAMTDRGALAIAQMRQVDDLFVGGFLTRQGVETLASIPMLKRLIVETSEVTDAEIDELKKSSTVPYFRIRPYNGRSEIDTFGTVRKAYPNRILGADGFFRDTASRLDSRNSLDALEGQPAPNLVGASDSPKWDWKEHRGKVVLIDFWGTWCGPCRMLTPTLEKLHAKYRDKGFEIVGVHTQQGAENLEIYVSDKKVSWPQLIDDSKEMQNRFSVPQYPSLFLVDRSGTLRVALVHRTGLEAAIVELLGESGE